MGCGGSKLPDEQQQASKAGANQHTVDIANLEKAQKQQHKGAEKGPKRESTSRVTNSGYVSDLASDGAAFTRGFVHSHVGKKALSELESKYEINEGTVLGRGACGSVVVVRHKTTQELFAMKVISIETMGGTMEELKREIEIQRTLDHPNICKIFESYEDTVNKEMYIIMEICTGGALVSRMKSHRHGYGERAAATLMEKILSSIIYCHHRTLPT